MTSIKNIAIVGVGDNVGFAILSALRKTSLKVTIISRLDSKSTFDPSIPIARTPYTLQDLTVAFRGQNAIISCLPMKAIDLEPILINAAVAAGAKWFMPSEWGCPTDERTLELLPILGSKRNNVQCLREKEGEGLSWTAVYPGLFLDWGLRWPFLGFHIKSYKADIWDDGDTAFTATNLSAVGRAVANLLTNSEALDQAENKYIHISTATTTQSELLRAFEQITGEIWKVNQLNGEEVVLDAKKRLPAGEFDAIVKLIQGMNFAKKMGWSRFDDKTENWNKLLGLDDEETVEETVRRVVREERVGRADNV